MVKISKKRQSARDRVDREHLYEPKEALELVKEIASAKFDETVELAMRLNVNPKHADQQVRGAVVLPHGTGKEVKVLVFAKGEKVTEAEEAGADFVGSDELAAKIQGGWFDFDVAVATPDMMGTVGKLGKNLGPRGLMPNPKSGTVTFDLKKAIADIKAGKIEYRVDKSGNIHVPIGKISFDIEKLEENFDAVYDSIIRARPATVRGQYVKNVTLSSTMSPGVKVVPQQVTG